MSDDVRFIEMEDGTTYATMYEYNRLRAEVDEALDLLGRCTEQRDRQAVKLAEAKERIEELESRDIGEECQEYDRAHGIYHITTKQIDKAWELTKKGARDFVVGAMEELGIIPCPKCGGGGRIPLSLVGGEISGNCQDCHGHGWVMEER